MFLYATVPQENKWNLATDLNMSFLRFKAAEERERQRDRKTGQRFENRPFDHETIKAEKLASDSEKFCAYARV